MILRYSKWIVKRINASRKGFKEGASESAKQELKREKSGSKEGTSESAKQELEKQLKSQAEQTQRKIMMG